MGFTIEMRLEGVDETIAELARFAKNINQPLKKAVLAAGRIIRDKARELAPEETKLLKKSIKATAKAFRDQNLAICWIGPDDDHRKEVTISSDRFYRWINGRRVKISNPDAEYLVMIRNPAKYAHLLEYGTKHTAAKPFLRPAFEAAKNEATAEFLRVLGEEIRNYMPGAWSD